MEHTQTAFIPIRLVALAILVVASGLFAGCATIVKGTHQDIPISSEPSGAAVLLNGQREGTTPMSLHVPRKGTHVVSIEKDGYEVENVTLTPAVGGAVAGNIVAGGLIGWGVDASTGAQYNLHPESITARLRPKEKPALNEKSGVESLMRELDALEEMKKAGKLSETEYAHLREVTLQKYQGAKP